MEEATSEKIYNAHVRPILDFAAHAWQPWLSETAASALEIPNNKALRLVTGQYKSSPIEAVIAEAGATTYATTSKRLILAAHEKALRCSSDHPSRLAVENVVTHKLAI